MMKEKKKYIQPNTGVVVLHDRLMLELPISNGYVDDEAAKQQNMDISEDFYGGNLWNEDEED